MRDDFLPGFGGYFIADNGRELQGVNGTRTGIMCTLALCSNVFFNAKQNQGKLGQIAAKTSVPIVSGSGAPRMCHSSYLGVKLTKQLFLMFSE